MKKTTFENAMKLFEQLWYTLSEAVAVLSRNSGHDVNRGYVSKLAATGVIRYRKITDKVFLYFREDVDNHNGVKQKQPRAVQTAFAFSDAVLA